MKFDDAKREISRQATREIKQKRKKLFRLNKAEREALRLLTVYKFITSTASVYERLVHYGFAYSAGLRLVSKSGKGVTYKSSFGITEAGLQYFKSGMVGEFAIPKDQTIPADVAAIDAFSESCRK